ncbi:hypothetical protein A6A19_04950 [Actinobacillus delphinicola]|uniref:hypothetical protein n=1 Tax=Actinobacillus delphinicola TaxID=51161 RepID=UPI0024419A80|nr:hypothetical protein [Actinobacillus delphinicola]MDG6897355.1 hypothetical protein [Actinobacillus delphinicola]
MLYRGQTLLSLMVAMALSIILLFVLIEFFTQIQYQNTQQFSYLYLQKTLESRLDQMVRDIRRAGFQAPNDHVIASNFSYFQQANIWKVLRINSGLGETEQSCILFFYDLDQSGCLGGKNNRGNADDKKTYCVRNGHNAMGNIENELFGYRLYQGMLQTRSLQKKDVDSYCDEKTCRSYMSEDQCNQGKWENLFDKNAIRILSLHFQPMADNRAVLVQLTGQLIHKPNIQYQTQAVIPLINLWKDEHAIAPRFH